MRKPWERVVSSLEGSVKEWVRKRTTQAHSLASDRRLRSESAAARSGFDAPARGQHFPFPRWKKKKAISEANSASLKLMPTEVRLR